MKVSLMDLVKPVAYYCAPLSDTAALEHCSKYKHSQQLVIKICDEKTYWTGLKYIPGKDCIPLFLMTSTCIWNRQLLPIAFETSTDVNKKTMSAEDLRQNKMSFKSNCAFGYLFLKCFVASGGTHEKHIYISEYDFPVFPAALLSFWISHFSCLTSHPAPPAQKSFLNFPLVSPPVTIPLSFQFSKDQQ